MREERQKRPKRFRDQVLLFITLCWIIPIVVLVTFMSITYRDTVIGKIETVLKEEAYNVFSVMTERLNDDIKLSQRWKVYSGQIEEQEKAVLYSTVSNYIGENYASDIRFRTSVFLPWQGEVPFVYMTRNGDRKSDFLEMFEDQIEEIRVQDTSKVFIRIINGRLFIIRNIYTVDRYQKFGTLVLEANIDKLFEGTREYSSSNMSINIDQLDSVLTVNQSTKGEKTKEASKEVFKKYQTIDAEFEKIKTPDYQGVFMQEKERDYHLSMVLLVEKASLYQDLWSLYRILGFIALALIPITVYIAYFLKKQFTDPVDRMVKVSKEITEGQIGTEIQGKPMPNAEFNYLMLTFNKMSRQIKSLFDYAYDEKLARKDAKILALQAQLNPHFLNNTLEMMNWQARISGDIAVSKMIEALSTILDYRMDRDDKRMGYLFDELRCADAYIYISSMRFGNRLTVCKEIDESVLQMKVPRLILQPILENAVIHGIERTQVGKIWLRIYHDEKDLHLVVTNSGKPLGEQEKKKIAYLLSGGMPKANPGYHNSLGIRNVNERIKLIYGEEYGLTIDSNEKNETVSSIRIPYRWDQDKKQKEEKKSVHEEIKIETNR